MAREIKFTPFGVPYILEFENVSFVPERRGEGPRPKNHPRTEPPDSESRCTFYSTSHSSSSSSFCYIESPPIPPRFPSFSFRSASSLFKRKPSQQLLHVHSSSVPSRTSDGSPTERPFWCANTDDTKPLPPPPPPPPPHSDVQVSDVHGIFIRSPLEHSHPQMSRKERLVHLQQTISIAVLDAGMSSSPGNNPHLQKQPNDEVQHGTRGHRTPDALFCGTYGQLISALESAGLSAAPCARDPGLSGHTRLGALFVARNDGGSGVRLRKITLWG